MTRPRGPQPPVPPRGGPGYGPGPGYPPQAPARSGSGRPVQGYAYPPGYAPLQTAQGQPPGYAPPGYGYAAPPGARPPVKATSHTKVLVILGVALLVAVGAFIVISRLVTPAASTAKTCDPNCGGPPPTGPAVAAKPRFTASDGSWSVEYPASDQHFSGFKKSSDALLADLSKFGSAILVQGGAAGGKTPEQVVQAYLQAKFADARPAYEIAHASVGYNPGYGEVLDDYPQTTSGSEGHARLIVLAAVRNDTYVLVVGYGPYRVFSRDGLNDAHPSGTASAVGFFMDPIINSVTWKGDPAR